MIVLRALDRSGKDIMLKSIDFFGSLLCGLLGCAASIGTGLFLELGQGVVEWDDCWM